MLVMLVSGLGIQLSIIVFPKHDGRPRLAKEKKIEEAPYIERDVVDGGVIWIGRARALSHWIFECQSRELSTIASHEPIIE